MSKLEKEVKELKELANEIYFVIYWKKQIEKIYQKKFSDKNLVQLIKRFKINPKKNKKNSGKIQKILETEIEVQSLEETNRL